jgi:argininosuccinate lyase
MKTSKSTLWNKGHSINKSVLKFTVGDDYKLDMHIIVYDCIATKAHTEMLGKIGVLELSEVKKIHTELSNLIKLIEAGKFTISEDEEDCHTAIENYLTKKLGKIGKKIHTARSRNDQVLTALRLYYKDELKEIKKLCTSYNNAFKKCKKKYRSINLPGYTHMRKAMPSSIALWAGAFIDSMEDNLKLIKMCEELIDQSPLGTGAGYGIPIDIDKKFTAEKLGFKKVQQNGIYTQMSRGKFESSILHAFSQIMFDINKCASDIILFSMQEFGYFELPKNICTGSSIMPQKQNPDALELLRAKYHVITGYEFQIKNITSNLISGYNRDVQLTKEMIIKSFETVKECLSVAVIVIENLNVNKNNCEKAMVKELFATEKAYGLMQKCNIPFREAYKKTAIEFLNKKK